MIRKVIMAMLVMSCAALAGCSNADTPAVETDTVKDTYNKEEVMQRDLGGMSPEEALKYMQETENLVIVDVAATRWYEEKTFEGAVNIPIEELDSEEEDARYMELPEGRPVLLHCRRGMIVPGAYERVKELRPDIPEISYIDGSPMFDEYNSWIAEAQ